MAIRRKNQMHLQWSLALNPYAYLDAAKQAFRKAEPKFGEQDLIDAVQEGLSYTDNILNDLLDPAHWGEKAKAEHRQPRIMLDTYLTNRGTLKIGYSLSDYEIFLGDEFDPWIAQGTQAGWNAMWHQWPKQQVAEFKHVGRYFGTFMKEHTDVHRYCVLAALAEVERIKRVMAYDLDVVAAPQFEQTWTEGSLAAVTYKSLSRVLADRKDSMDD